MDEIEKIVSGRDALEKRVGLVVCLDDGRAKENDGHRIPIVRGQSCEDLEFAVAFAVCAIRGSAGDCLHRSGCAEERDVLLDAAHDRIDDLARIRGVQRVRAGVVLVADVQGDGAGFKAFHGGSFRVRSG